MPKLIKFKKLGLPSSRGAFYENLFSCEFEVDLTHIPLPAETLKQKPGVLSLIRCNSASGKKLPIAMIMINLVYMAQLFMLTQEKTVANVIIDESVNQILEGLQWVYKCLHPEDKSDNEADKKFWQFVSDTYREAIEYDYNEKMIKNHFINLMFWRKILMEDNIRNMVCEELDFPSWLQSLPINTEEAIKKAVAVREELILGTEKLYFSATEPDISLSSQIGLYVGITVIAYFDFYSGFAGLVQSLLMSTFYGQSHRRLTKNTELQIINEQKEVIQKNFGSIVIDNLNDANRKILVKACLPSMFSQVFHNRKLIKKRIKSDYTVYVPSYKFPQIIIAPTESKIPHKPTKTQVHKMRPQALISLPSNLGRAEDKNRERKIELHTDFKGWLVHGQGHSLFAILPPTNDSEIKSEEVKKIVCALRGPLAAKKFGQKGAKLRTDGNMCLKYDKVRILCRPNGKQEIGVNSVKQTIPVYVPFFRFEK